MLQINTFKSGKWRSIDLYDLPIAGTWAHKLPQPDLFRELKKLGVAGIEPSMGWQQLATIWGNVLADRKEASK